MNCSFSRRARAAAAIAAGASAIALAGALPAAAAPRLAHQHARHPAPARHYPVRRAVRAVVLVDCEHKGVVAPRMFILTCADANDYLTGLRWVSWHGVAYGSGTEHINTCVPNCAAGHFRRYRALITVWRARPFRAGLFQFTRLTEIYPGRRPLRFGPHGRKFHPLTYTWQL